MKKWSALLALCLLYSTNCYAQSLNVFTIDTSDFPVMRSEFFLLDDVDNQVSDQVPADFSITENGQPCNILSVDCPITQNAIPLSTVLTMDISGSMSGERHEFSMAAGELWITQMTDNSDCAITAFDHYNYFICDFTQNKDKLRAGLNSLRPGGNTDFNAALINPMAGALLAAQKGKNKRIVIMLTDGSAHGDYNKILAMAQQHNISIYSVVLLNNAPVLLKQLAEDTDALCFDNIKTIEEIKQVYSYIAIKASNQKPCTIEWESAISCKASRRVEYLNNPYQVSDNKSYVIHSNIPQITCEPRLVKFGECPPGTPVSQKVTVTAYNEEFTVNNIQPTNHKFSVSPVSFTLAPGQSRDIDVTYTPTDSSFESSKFEFDLSFCTLSFYATGGYTSQLPTQSTLEIMHPNGAEHFLAGSDTIITWDGVFETDTVQLYFSSDNGSNWEQISDDACGLKEFWKKLPLVESDQCLIRATQDYDLDEQETPGSILLGNGVVQDYKYSPLGNAIAIATSIGLFVYTPEGYLLRQFIHDSTFSTSVAWNRDATYLAVGCDNGHIYILRYNGWVQDLDIPAHDKKITSLNWSHSNGNIGSVSDDGTAKIWGSNTGNLLSSFDKIPSSYRSIDWCNDGRYLIINYYQNLLIYKTSNWTIEVNTNGLSSGARDVTYRDGIFYIATAQNDNRINIWNTAGAPSILTDQGHSDEIYQIDWNKTGTQFATASIDGTIKVWNGLDGHLIKSISIPNTPMKRSIEWAGDDLSVASYLEGPGIVAVNIQYGTQDGFIPFYSSVSCIDWSPDGKMVAVGQYTGKVIFHTLDGKVQEFPLGTNNLKDIYFTPDGKRLIAYTYRSTFYVFDIDGTNITMSSEILRPFGSRFSLSPDGSLIAFARNTTNVMICDSYIFDEILELSGLTSYPSKALWSPDGSMIAGFEQYGKIIIWDTDSYTIKHEPNISSLVDMAWDPSTNNLLTLNGKVMHIVDGSTGEIIRDIALNNHYDMLSISNDGTYVSLGNYNQKTLSVYNMGLNEFEYTLSGHFNGVNTLKWSPYNMYLASGSSDASVRLWGPFQATAQSDVSDAVFSISIPHAALDSIYMGEEYLGNKKDSLITDFLVNTGQWPVRTDSIYFRGPDSDAFRLVGGLPVYSTEAGASHYAEIVFTPSRLGLHNAEVVVITQSEELVCPIVGMGIEKVLDLATGLIDFGKVKIFESKDSLDAPQIVNLSSKPLSFSLVGQGGPDMTNFEIISPGLPATLAPGETCRLDLRFAPQSVGRFSGSVEFHYEGTGSPARVRLYGEGYDDKPQIQAARPQFPDLLCENICSSTFSISNPGMSDLIIDEVKIDGSDPEYFEFSTGLPITVPPDGRVTANINYISDTPGDQEAELQLISNAYPDSILTVMLSGHKDSLWLAPSSNSFDAGYVCTGQPIEYQFELTNHGTIGKWTNFYTLAPVQFPDGDKFIAPGATETIRAIYSGNSSAGEYSSTIVLLDTICYRDINFTLHADIIEHNIGAEDIYFGRLCPGQSIDTTITITNYGPLDLVAYLISSPDISFSSATYTLIPPGSDVTFPLHFDGCNAEGRYISHINIADSLCGNIKVIELSADIVMPDFSVKDQSVHAMAGESASFTLPLTNHSDFEIIVTGISNLSEPFAVCNTPFPMPVAAGATEYIEFIYSPSSPTISIQKLTINAMPCGAIQNATLTGIFASATAQLRLPDAEAKPGQHLTVPVLLENNSGIEFSGVETIDLDICYNNTLLAPIGYKPQVLSKDISCIHIEEIPIDVPRDTLATVDFIAGLGKVKSCPLTLNGDNSHDGLLDLTYMPGTFTLKGVCPDGGDRLINPNSVIALHSISPNPARETITIDFSLYVKAESELIISDLTGRQWKHIPLKGVMGENSMIISIRDLKAGCYYIQLRTPTVEFICPLVVIK